MYWPALFEWHQANTHRQGASKRTRCHVGPRPARLQKNGLLSDTSAHAHASGNLSSLQAAQCWRVSSHLLTMIICSFAFYLPVMTRTQLGLPAHLTLTPEGVVRACVSSTPLPDMALAMPTSAILHVSVRVSRQLLLLMSMCRICAHTCNQGHRSMQGVACKQQMLPLLTCPGADTGGNKGDFTCQSSSMGSNVKS